MNRGRIRALIAPDWTIKVLLTDSIGARYPRVVQLQHYAAGKAHILLTYAGRPGPMPIYRSTDNGETCSSRRQSGTSPTQADT